MHSMTFDHIRLDSNDKYTVSHNGDWSGNIVFWCNGVKHEIHSIIIKEVAAEMIRCNLIKKLEQASADEILNLSSK